MLEVPFAHHYYIIIIRREDILLETSQKVPDIDIHTHRPLLVSSRFQEHTFRDTIELITSFAASTAKTNAANGNFSSGAQLGRPADVKKTLLVSRSTSLHYPTPSNGVAFASGTRV